MKNLLFIVLGLLIPNVILGQASYLGNNSTTPTDYLGWNSGVTFDLNIKHDNTKNINFWTNTNQRMTILSSGNVGIGSANPTQIPQVPFMKLL